MGIKDISKEVLANCKRIRPNEFKEVTRTDVERIMSILENNLIRLLLSESLLALKNIMLFRPNLKKKVAKQEAMNRKTDFLRNNDLLNNLDI